MNKLEATFAAIFVLVAYLFVGTQDYQIAKAAEEEKKVVSAEREARIWSQKCSKRGLQVYATQADGGKWVVRCAKATAMVKA